MTSDRTLGGPAVRKRNSGITLKTAPTFYSDDDERAFVEWIGRLTFLTAVDPEFTHGTLHMLKRPNRDELWNLIALFHRYQLPMKQLAVFENANNRKWFRKRGMFWYASIFGEP